jgi:hypothetical protein
MIRGVPPFAFPISTSPEPGSCPPLAAFLARYLISHHVEDRPLPLKQTARHLLDPPPSPSAYTVWLEPSRRNTTPTEARSGYGQG